MSILDEYMKQVELDKVTYENDERIDENDDVKNHISQAYTDEEFIDMVNKLRNDPNDPANKFKREYPYISENELRNNDLVAEEEVTAKIIRAYCPKCGKELKCLNKLFVNPYTNDRIAKHECSCGFKANLEYAYPRLIFTDKMDNKVEINIQ